ncbi:MAG: hypothetical protein AB1758_22375 [Candidatus Eremiobacterota bacterium]
MEIRPEFQQFIGSSSWGKQNGMFFTPGDSELQAGAFEVPVDPAINTQGALSRYYLDLINIGHNASDFNAMDPGVQEFATQLAQRRGLYQELIDAHGDAGKKAMIHMTNVADAHQGLIDTMLSPAGPALVNLTEAVAANVAQSMGGPVALAIGTAWPTKGLVAADVYRVERQEYMGAELPGVYDKEPVARVYLDLENGVGYQLPDDKFQGRS